MPSRNASVNPARSQSWPFCSVPNFSLNPAQPGPPRTGLRPWGRPTPKKTKSSPPCSPSSTAASRQLQLPGFQKPFFIQYRIEDIDDFDTRAAFGATQGSNRNRGRVARVTVLVGDYKTDSSGAVAATVPSKSLPSTTIPSPSAPPCGLQRIKPTKQLSPPTRKSRPHSSRLKHRRRPTTSAARSLSSRWPHRRPSPSTKQLGKSVSPTTAASSAPTPLSTPSPDDLQYANAAFHARVTTTRLVNREGTIVRKSSANYQETFAVGTQAADGMRLDRSYGSTGMALADLDAPDVFTQHAVQLIASLGQLHDAPLVEEEYHGPVLLSADASTDTLRRLLGTGRLATRPRLGTEARTNGPFASSFHARVLPDFLDVTDDPSLKTLSGKSLLGAYDIDDEGVPAQSVPLVSAGRLENYLIGRQPVRDFPQSNGHARAAISGPARPSLGVLKITARDGLSDDDLNKKLLAMAKDRDLKSVYFVETLGGPLAPRLLYRIAPDGVRTLVRGARLADLDDRALRSSVEAAGKDLWVGNFTGEIPETVLAPALLLDDITIRRANEKNDKLPFYPPPD